MLYEITDAVAHRDHTVAVTWSDGTCVTVGFAPFLGRGGVLTALGDPDYFVNEMRIQRGGIGLTWSNEVDCSADGLRQDAFPPEQSGEYDEPLNTTMDAPSSPHHSPP